MKRILLIIAFIFSLAVSFNSCKAQDYIEWISTAQTYETIKYGALYNWYAATDSRKITSSDDWVVPTIEQWEELGLSFGGEIVQSLPEILASITIAGEKLTESGNLHWDNANPSTNDFGFSIRGSGERENGFFGLKTLSLFHSSSTADLDQNKYGISIFSFSVYGYDAFSMLIERAIQKYSGASIRLVRSATVEELSLPDGLISAIYTGNNGIVYPCTKRGNQIWLSGNLNETKFRNGDWIHGYDGGVYTTISNEDWDDLEIAGMCWYNNDINNK